MESLFGLKVGMRDKVLLAEIARVGLHGENRTQLKTLMRDVEGEIAYHELHKIEKPSFDVVAENGTHALLIEYHWYSNDDAKPYRIRYWLSGINDEQNYFLRLLNLESDAPEYERRKTGKHIPDYLLRDLTMLVNHVNRADQGFERLQGDILVRFVPYEEHARGLPNNTKINRDIQGGLLGGTRYQYRIPYQRASDGEDAKGECESLRLRKNETFREIDFGSHYVRTDGILVPPDSFMLEPLVVDGERFVLSHPEHGKRVVDIPKGHYAVLGAQRGQNGILGQGRRTANLD